jgi:regulator of sigma E protease
MSSLLWFVILIGILIFAHEGGHFLFAKLFGVKVLTFSLGFGGPIRVGRFKLSWKPGETEYRIAWFPAGGFVRMLGDDPTEAVVATDRSRAFLTQPAWKRFFIIFGGPLFSVLLAVPIYFVYHLVQSNAAGPVVGSVVAGLPAAEAGVLPGDKLLSIGDTQVQTWEDVDEAIQALGGAEVAIQLERSGQTSTVRAKPVEELDETGLELLGERWDLGLRHNRQGNIIGVVTPGSPAARAGLQSWDKVLQVAGVPVSGWADAQRILERNGTHLATVEVVRAAEVAIGAITLRVPVLVEVVVQPMPADQAPAGALTHGAGYSGIEPIDLYVMGVLDDFPAKQAGIQPGDKILSMFGQPVHSWELFSRLVLAHPDSEIPLTVRHQGEIRELALKPKVIEETNEFKQVTRKPGLGVAYQPNLLAGERIERPDRWAYAAKMSVVQTGRAMSMNVLGFVRIFQGRVDAREAIGGPLMILDVAGKSAERGLGTFLNMMAFLSVLLGILNLLPIPILDGGHIAFILIEAVRRKPLSVGARVIASYVGLVLLVGLMAFAFYNDITRYWSEISSLFG